MALSRAATLLTAAGMLAPSAARALDDGWTAFQAGRRDEAVTLWRAEAEAGDPSAALGLGIAYDLGRGVPADPAAACLWYQKAAEAGLGEAAFNLAVMVDAGRCGSPDAPRAALWYARAAAAGHARAQYDLAQLYAAGEGVPHNAALARAWADAAAANGVKAAAELARAQAPKPADLTAAELVSPAGSSAANPRGGNVALVWTSAEQPAGARFYIEVYAVGNGGPSLVRSEYAPLSADVVLLPPGDFAWRVLTADPVAGRYVASGWATFSVAPRS